MKLCVKCGGSGTRRDGVSCKYCCWWEVKYPLMRVQTADCYWDAVNECGLYGADAESAAVTCHVNHGGKLRYVRGELVLDDGVLW